MKNPSPGRWIACCALFAVLVAAAYALSWDDPLSSPTDGVVQRVSSHEHDDAAGDDDDRSADRSPTKADVAGPVARREVEASQPAELELRVTQGGEGAPGLALTLRPSAKSEAGAYRTTTGAAGHAAFYAVPSGRYRLHIDGDRAPAGLAARWVQIQAEQTTNLGEIAIPAPATVRGRVVDPAGAPIADAWVLAGRGSRYSKSFDHKTIDSEQLDPDSGVVTGADGQFELGRQLPGKFATRVEAPGFEPQVVKGTLGEGAVSDLGDVKLKRGPPIRGRVVLSDGSPVASARVVPVERRTRSPRLGVTTDVDGRFELRSVGSAVGGLAVDDPRYVMYETHALRGPTARESFQRLTVHRAAPLRGEIRGARGATTVEFGGGTTSAPHWHDLAYEEFPVGDGGRFEVPRFVPGSWKLTVRVDGIEVVEDHRFDWQPGDEPLVVELPETFDVAVRVVVRDDLGEPIEGASVFVHEMTRSKAHRFSDDERWLRKALGSYGALAANVPTDAGGRAEIALPLVADPDRTGIAIGVRSGDHLPSGSRPSMADVARPVEIVLPRAAAIAGTLADPAEVRHCQLFVRMHPVGDASGRGGVSAPVDAQGRFHRGGMPAGRYSLALWRRDSSREDDATKRPPNVIPVMSSASGFAGGGYGKSVEVVLMAGETTQVELDLPRAARVRGIVTAAGRPVAGIQVFGIATPPGGSRPEDWLREKRGAFGGGPVGMGEFGHFDSSHAGNYSPRQRTGEDGAFCFLFDGPGTYWIYARAPDSVVAAPPVPVVVTSAAEELQVDIALPGAVVTGRFDLAGLPPAPTTLDPRKRRRAPRTILHLFRSETAHVDPYLSQSSFTAAMLNPSPMALDSDVTAVFLEGEGQFRIPFVPPGDWVLRIHRYGGRPLVTRSLKVTAHDGVLDLGELRVATGHTVRLKVNVPAVPKSDPQQFTLESPNHFRVHLLAPSSGLARHVFLQGVKVVDGVALFEEVPPGSYHIELMQGVLTSDRIDGRPLEAFADIVVDARGVTTPESIDWSGIDIREER
ncbi:MAG: carboxypeptidase-like regulatory domain-containing protein [Planctomycetota bacterium]